MIRINIAFFTLALLALVGCSNADQVLPAEKVVANETEVVTGDWVAKVYVETVEGTEVVHTHPVPNTAAYWTLLEAGGEYIPNPNAIEEDMGPAKDWAPELKEEDIISMGMRIVDLSVEEGANKIQNELPSHITGILAHACSQPFYNVGILDGITYRAFVTCGMGASSPAPGYCVVDLFLYGWTVVNCEGPSPLF